MIPVNEPLIGEKEIKYVLDCLKTGSLKLVLPLFFTYNILKIVNAAPTPAEAATGMRLADTDGMPYPSLSPSEIKAAVSCWMKLIT